MRLAFTLPAQNAYATGRNTGRGTGLLVTLLLHLLLFLGWQASRKAPHVDTDPAQAAIQWVNIQADRPLKPKVTPPEQAVPAPRVPPPVAPTALQAPTPQATPPRAVPSSTPSSAPSAVLSSIPAPARASVPDAQPSAAPAPAAPLSAYEMLQQAKRNVGKIDRDLRKAYPGQPITAPVTNGATRLEQGLQAAADAAPNKWYEAPKVTEIVDPGPYNRRRYRVVGARGTYCITVESNHAPDGIDQMQKGIQQKITNCEANEQSATKQDYNKNYNK